MSSTSPAAAIVLAAGGSQRFGTPKQLAPFNGRPLVCHAIDAAVAAGCAPVFVVVGHAADRVRSVLPEEVVPVHNPAYATGQASSLRAGIAAAVANDVEGLVVLLADQPLVDPMVIRQVSAALSAGHSVVRARYEDRPGHPVAFARMTFGALAHVGGDAGARDLLEELGVHELRVAGTCPADVDTPADLRRLTE